MVEKEKEKEIGQPLIAQKEIFELGNDLAIAVNNKMVYTKKALFVILNEFERGKKTIAMVCAGCKSEAEIEKTSIRAMPEAKWLCPFCTQANMVVDFEYYHDFFIQKMRAKAGLITKSEQIQIKEKEMAEREKALEAALKAKETETKKGIQAKENELAGAKKENEKLKKDLEEMQQATIKKFEEIETHYETEMQKADDSMAEQNKEKDKKQNEKNAAIISKLNQALERLIAENAALKKEAIFGKQKED